MQSRRRCTPRLGLGAVARVAHVQLANPVFRQRQRIGHHVFKRGLAELAHVTVGIMLGRQKQKAHLFAIAQRGQCVLQRAPSRALSRSVAIKAEHHFISHPQQALRVRLGGRGAERCDHILNAVLRQRHHIHVALNHEHAIDFSDRSLRLKQAVQLSPLAEYRRLG